MQQLQLSKEITRDQIFALIERNGEEEVVLLLIFGKMTHDNSTISTEKFEQLFGFIEANTPIPAATLGVFSREIKSLAKAFINEAAGNFTALPPTKVRKYRGLLMDRLEELSFYHYEEVAEAWMALRTLEDITEEIIQLNNTFIEAMADKGYSIYKTDDIGEVRHTKVVTIKSDGPALRMDRRAGGIY